MSEVAERIDALIDASLAPVLRQAGYRKSGRTFRRREAHCVQVVNVQSSWTNTGSNGQFTMNLGVYFPEAAKLHGEFRVTEKPTESDCIVSARIGELMPRGLDHWWKITKETDLRTVGNEVVAAWFQFGDPWLRAHAAPQTARTSILELGFPFWGAIFSLLLDDRPEALRLLQEAVTASDSRPDIQAALRRWGEKHGLLLDAAV